MKSRRMMLRLTAVALMALAALCVEMQGRNVDLIRRDGPGLTAIELYKGTVSVSWEPRAPYRSRWAGPVNRMGLRYDIYSNGSWYAWAPLWAPAAAFAAAALITGCASWRRRPGRVAGFCPQCCYHLRATPDRCPECGTGFSRESWRPRG